MGNYSRESTATLPDDDTDLSTIYSAQDIIDVSTQDGIYVGQSESAANTIHQYKNTVVADTAVLRWRGKSGQAASVNPVKLQIFNRTSSTWEDLTTESVAAADTDFELNAIKNVSSNYKDGSNVISCRVYQAASISGSFLIVEGSYFLIEIGSYLNIQES